MYCLPINTLQIFNPPTNITVCTRFKLFLSFSLYDILILLCYLLYIAIEVNSKQAEPGISFPNLKHTVYSIQLTFRAIFLIRPFNI